MDLKKYVLELNDAYQEKRIEWQTMQDRLVAIQDEEAEVNKSVNSPVMKAADFERLENEKKETNQKLSELQEAAGKKFDQIRDDFNREVTDFFTAKPENVDQAATLLLDSGALTDDDLCALVKRYSDNTTMLKLIMKAAENMGSEIGNSLNASIKAFISTAEREDTFEGASLTAYRALSPNRDFAEPNAHYWDNELFEKAQKDIAETEKLNVEGMTPFLK